MLEKRANVVKTILEEIGDVRDKGKLKKNIETLINTSIDLFSGDKCKDQYIHCVSWAAAGFCTLSPDPMLTVCPESCDVCTEVCEDNPRYSRDCPAWADYGYCIRSPTSTDHVIMFMLNNCRKSCGVCSPGIDFISFYCNMNKPIAKTHAIYKPYKTLL